MFQLPSTSHFIYLQLLSAKIQQNKVETMINSGESLHYKHRDLSLVPQNLHQKKERQARSQVNSNQSAEPSDVYSSLTSYTTVEFQHNKRLSQSTRHLRNSSQGHHLTSTHFPVHPCAPLHVCTYIHKSVN